MKFLNRFLKFVLISSYIGIGGLLFSHFHTDYLNIFSRFEFWQTLVVLLGFSNILHIETAFLNRKINKRVQLQEKSKFEHMFNNKF